MQNRIKEFRNSKGLTLDEMSEQIGIKRGTLNNYENSKTEPKLETWEKLARFFNVRIPVVQGIELSFTDKLNQIGAILFDNYVEWQYDSDIDIEPKFQLLANHFRTELKQYCKDNSIHFRVDDDDVNPDTAQILEYYTLQNDFKSKLSSIIHGITMRYQFMETSGKIEKKIYRSANMDPRIVLQITIDYLAHENRSRQRFESKEFTIENLREQLKQLELSLKQRTIKQQQNEWTSIDEENLVLLVNNVEKLSTSIFKDIQRGLN